MGAALVVAALGGCLGWPQPGYGPGKGSYDPRGATFAPGETPTYAEPWSVDVPGAMQVLAWRGRAYVLSDSFFGPPQLTSYDAATGAHQRTTTLGDFGVTEGAFAYVSEERVVAVTTDVVPCDPGDPRGCAFDHVTEAHAFDVATGGPAPMLADFGDTADTGVPQDAAVGRDIAVVPFAGGALRVVPFRALNVVVELTGADTRFPVLDEAAGRAYAAGDTVAAWPTARCPGAVCVTSPAWSVGGGPFGPLVLDATGLYTLEEATGQVRAVDPATGSTRWRSEPTAAIQGAGVPRPALRDGIVYAAGVRSAALTAFAECGADTCAPLWSSEQLAEQTGEAVVSPAAAGSLVYVARSVGSRHETELLGYRAEGCGAPQCPPVARLQLSGDPLELIAGGGRVFVRTTSGLHSWAVRR